MHPERLHPEAIAPRSDCRFAPEAIPDCTPERLQSDPERFPVGSRSPPQSDRRSGLARSRIGSDCSGLCLPGGCHARGD